MAYETISSGITLTIPTSGTINWASALKSGAWQKISEHDHTGGGKGLKIGLSGIGSNVIDKTALVKNLTDYQVLHSVAGTTENVNWNDGRVHVLDISASSGNVTATLQNPLEGGRYILKVISHASNKLALAGGTIKWPQGEDPTEVSEYFLSLASGAVDMIYLYYDGSSYLASWDVGLA